MNESIKFVPPEERRARFPSSYVRINGRDTNPDAWPIQIRNGVISIDFGAGCLGCVWCITKRQKGRDVTQNISYKNLLSAENMLSLLQRTKAFTQAQLPLRIGNNTDGTLIPIRELDLFYKNIQKNVPVVLLTRGVHTSEFNKFLATTGKNFILCRTITPPHKSLNYKVDWDKAFQGFEKASCQKVLNIGPIVQETFQNTLAILQSGQIHAGTRVILAPLNRRLMPDHVLTTVTAKPIAREQLQILEQTARNNGLVVHRANNCAIADFNGRPSVEYGDINSDINYHNQFGSDTIGTSNNRGLESVCSHCKNYDTCADHYYRSDRFITDKKLRELADLLGISDVRLVSQTPGLVVIQASGITKSETSYMSGMLRTRVTGINSLAQPDQQAAERWMRSDFYPVEDIVAISEHFDPLRFAKTANI